MKRFTYTASILSAVSFLSAACMCHAAEPAASRTGFFFDTVTTISLYDTSDEALLDACFDQMQVYECMLSRTVENSDIWNINHSGGASVSVHDETARLIEKAVSYCELTDGAFDITIAPVVDLWDFHDDVSNHQLPDPDALTEALSHVDYHNIIIDGSDITLLDPDAKIDLGAIAKGYISDRLKDTLRDAGCKSALINLGGNVVTLGSKPDGSSWKVGIREPFGATTSDLAAVVPVIDQSVITSGNYERYFVLDGTLYHHILSSKTGYPVNNDIYGVSILSDSATDGDALSTVCFVAGLDKALSIIESLPGTEALFITSDRQQITSSGWPH